MTGLIASAAASKSRRRSFTKPGPTKRGYLPNCRDCHREMSNAYYHRTKTSKKRGPNRQTIVVPDVPPEQERRLRREVDGVRARQVRCEGCAHSFVTNLVSHTHCRLLCPSCLDARVAEVMAERGLESKGA